MAEKEIRCITDKARIETRDDGSIGKITGYAIVYNRDSEDMGFVEQIAPGAAKKALKRSDIRALKNHDPNLIFGRQGVNLKLVDDASGLRYEATPIETQNFREIAEEIRSGLLTGQSFGFTVKSDEWKGLDTDHPTRTITEIDQIFDVGPVTYPAYQDTTVAVRSLEAAKSEKPEEKTETDEKITITVNDESFDFIGENRFEEATEKITELRSSLIPMNPDEDITEPDPMIETDSDLPTGDETLEKINRKIQEYS